MKPTLVIMAAGMGSRYGGLKQIEPMGLHGELLMEYAIFDAIKAGFGSVVFIIKAEILADFQAVVGDRMAKHIQVSYVCQGATDYLPDGISVERSRPWGTGHAVLCLLGTVRQPFCVINADDFYGYAAFASVSQFLQDTPESDPFQCCMAGFHIENTLTDYGYVSRGVCNRAASGKLLHIVERTKIQQRNGVIMDLETGTPIAEHTPVSMNFWGFPASILPEFQTQFEHFLHTANDLTTAEFYLPDVVDTLLKENRATVTVLPTDTKWYGVTYREDREPLQQALAQMRAQGLYPENLWG